MDLLSFGCLGSFLGKFAPFRQDPAEFLAVDFVGRDEEEDGAEGLHDKIGSELKGNGDANGMDVIKLVEEFMKGSKCL